MIANDAIAAALDAAIQSPRFKYRWRTAARYKGNCFVVAPLVAEMLEASGYKCVVVHGAPTLQCEPFAPYAHAWAEVSFILMEGGPDEITVTFAIDYSNGLRAILPTFMYYSLGRIDPAESRVYTLQDALARAVATGHYGPYHNTDHLL
jgi:hypothetical protein